MKTIIKKSGYQVLFALMMLFILSPAIAQEKKEMPGQDGRADRFERIRAMKVAYITQELKLTPDEAEKFWPLYNEFEDKRNEIVNGIMKGPPREMPDLEGMSDEEVNELIILKFKEERAMVDLQEEYYAKYKKVLPIKKIARYYEAEKRFRSHLLQGIRDGDFGRHREEPRKSRDN